MLNQVSDKANNSDTIGNPSKVHKVVTFEVNNSDWNEKAL